MQQEYDFHLTQRAIDLLMKIAAVILTSVATLNVARDAFSHVPDPWLTIIQIGALLLIEGAFVASWLAIDTQHQAPMAMKVAWAITLVVIYLALLVIAIEHGEGTAGWAFRLVLAVMIGRSIFESGAYEVLRGAKRADRDIRSAREVRRASRQLAKQDAMRAMKQESTDGNYARELADQVSRSRLEIEHEAAMLEVQLMRERLLEQVKARDNLARQKLQEHIADEIRQPAQKLILRRK